MGFIDRFKPVDNAVTEERMFRAGALHVTSSIPADKIAIYQKTSVLVLFS